MVPALLHSAHFSQGDKQGEYYLPLWKEETTLLKLHPQLTYKQNEKQYYKHTL